MPDPATPPAEFWKRKLAAFLHDSPDKVLDILDHEKRARRIAGEIQPDERARKEADWAASAADRLPFPRSSETFTPLGRFLHPLGESEIPLDESSLPIGQAEQTSQTTRPSLNEDDPRAAFISTWRFWRNWASARHADFALYPAETRLPDHTIWNHLAVTSAMQGCLSGEPWKPKGDKGVADHPAFLLFTIGPVQEFILAARSTRDLWSGSYLLSYLISHVLRRIALDFGPDHVLFPNLCDQPIMDLLLREEIWDKVSTRAGRPLFEAFNYCSDEGRERLLTPSLPNRFLTVLPSEMNEHRNRGEVFASTENYARHLATDLRVFLRTEIAAEVSAKAAEALGERFDARRFAKQVEQLLEIHWQILPWPQSFSEAEKLADHLPRDSDDYAPRAGLRTMRHLAQHGADARYLDKKGQPQNIAAAWSAFYAAADWLLDGAKANRGFSASIGGDYAPAKSNTKDSLTGRAEAVLIVGDDVDAKALSGRLRDALGKNHLLKAGEALAAGTLIKRLWPFAYLCRRHAFEPDDLAMPNTRSMAAHRPWEDDDGLGERGEGDRYFAILALDGDSMGKWISGALTPKLNQTLSKECVSAYEKAGAKLAEHHRPLSPAWHLQFSEALGNFSQHAVRRIVEAFDGRLLYSGGDDVLAMLPADTALASAAALRLAFRGDPAVNDTAKGTLHRVHDEELKRDVFRSDRTTPLFAVAKPGFLKLDPQATDRHGAGAPLLDDPVNFPVIVPGPAADCSVEIAIAHYKAPLQDVVRAAHAAEKRAKNQLGRAAVAVSLFKRSGEITEWGCRWDSGGMALYQSISDLLHAKKLSGRFPHRVCALLDSYTNLPTELVRKILEDAPDFDAAAIIAEEFAFAAERHGSKNTATHLIPFVEKYLSGVKRAYDADSTKRVKENRSPPSMSAIQTCLAAFIGLCTTVAFAHRTRSETYP